MESEHQVTKGGSLISSGRDSMTNSFGVFCEDSERAFCHEICENLKIQNTSKATFFQLRTFFKLLSKFTVSNLQVVLEGKHVVKVSTVTENSEKSCRTALLRKAAFGCGAPGKAAKLRTHTFDWLDWKRHSGNGIRTVHRNAPSLSTGSSVRQIRKVTM